MIDTSEVWHCGKRQANDRATKINHTHIQTQAIAE